MSIPYPVFIARAMRSILKDVLERVISHGIHEPNAVYIRFLKNHPGVDMPDWTRARIAPETTIVLQHDFTGLSVTDIGFSVTLKFGGIPARLHIPFASVVLFSDPGADIQIPIPAVDGEAPKADAADPVPVRDAASEKSGADGSGQTEGKVVSLSSFRK